MSPSTHRLTVTSLVLPLALAVVVPGNGAAAQRWPPAPEPTPIVLRGAVVRVQTDAEPAGIVGTVYRITADSLVVVRGPDTVRWERRAVWVEMPESARSRRRNIGAFGAAVAMLASTQLPYRDPWQPLAGTIGSAVVGHAVAMAWWPTRWRRAEWPPSAVLQSAPVLLRAGEGPVLLAGQRARVVVRRPGGVSTWLVRLQGVRHDSLMATTGPDASPIAFALPEIEAIFVSVGSEEGLAASLAAGTAGALVATVPFTFLYTLLLGVPRWVVPGSLIAAGALGSYAMWDRTRERFEEARLDVIP